MKLHANARLTPFQRTLMRRRVREDGWSVTDTADAAGCSERTMYRWLNRFDAGEELTDRSSAPWSVPGRTSREGRGGDRAAAPVAVHQHPDRRGAGSPTSTVGAVLKRLNLNRLSKLEPLEPPNRYCRRHPGELIHVDVKKLGRFRRPAIASLAVDRAPTPTTWDGKPCTSASMTPLVSPMSKSSTTRPPPPRWGSSNVRSLGSRCAASPSNVS